MSGETIKVKCEEVVQLEKKLLGFLRKKDPELRLVHVDWEDPKRSFCGYFAIYLRYVGSTYVKKGATK